MPLGLKSERGQESSSGFTSQPFVSCMSLPFGTSSVTVVRRGPSDMADSEVPPPAGPRRRAAGAGPGRRFGHRCPKVPREAARGCWWPQSDEGAGICPPRCRGQRQLCPRSRSAPHGEGRPRRAGLPPSSDTIVLIRYLPSGGPTFR